MSRVYLLIMVILFTACGNGDGIVEEDLNVFTFDRFSSRFKAAKLSYELSDTALLNNKDTTVIRNKAFLAYIPDSLQTYLFGKNAKPKYTPLVKISSPEKGSYFILEGSSGQKKAALLVIFNSNNSFAAAFPFLKPDSDRRTYQRSIVDKSFSITRVVSKRNEDGAMREGKEVYAFDPSTSSFTLVMTDLLDDSNVELINPIDTFARLHKYAADYIKDKNNMVSVRDGRNDKEINFFIHFEKNKGECTGELKGTAFFVTSKKAVYRPAAEPCVLELNFTSTSVSIKEQNCGTHRGVQCLFDGTYPKKRQSKTKSSTGKT